MINTCSALIGFYGRFEESVADFYTDLSEMFPDHEEFFLSLAKENRKHKMIVERAYREVITDALEACFISDMDEEEYEIDTEIPDEMVYREAIERAVDIEEENHRLCKDAEEGTRGLLADITHAFQRVAREKEKRLKKLKNKN